MEEVAPKGVIRISLDDGPAFRLELERGYRRLTLVVTSAEDLAIRAQGLDGKKGASFFEGRVGSSEALVRVLEWLDGILDRWPLR